MSGRKIRRIGGVHREKGQNHWQDPHLTQPNPQSLRIWLCYYGSNAIILVFIQAWATA